MAIKTKKNGKWVDIYASVPVDTELKKEFYPAEAKAVGDKFQQIETDNFDKHQEYETNFGEMGEKIDDLDNHANILHRNFLHLNGITLDTLWTYPKKEEYYKEEDVFKGEDNSMVFIIPDLGNVEKYPWLIITSQNSTLIVHNHTQKINLSYTQHIPVEDYATTTPQVIAHSRPVYIDTDNKTITFKDNYVVYLQGQTDQGYKAGLNNASNKPYAILGVCDLNYSDYGLEELLTQNY